MNGWCVKQALVYSLSAYADEHGTSSGAHATAEHRFSQLQPSGLSTGYHSLLLQPSESVCCMRWQVLDEPVGAATTAPAVAGATPSTTPSTSSATPSSSSATASPTAGWHTRTLKECVAVCAPLLVVLTTQRVLILSPSLTVLTTLPSLLPQSTPRPLTVSELALPSEDLTKRGPLFRVPVTAVSWLGSAVVLGTGGGALLYATAQGRVGRLASLDRTVWNPVVTAALPDRLVIASSHWQTGRCQVRGDAVGRGVCDRERQRDTQREWDQIEAFTATWWDSS